MADEKLLEILLRGSEAWNSYRKENPVNIPDLSRADLSGESLSGVNLHRADLRGTDFSGADLTNAILANARLIGADLSRANLANVNFIDADLRRVNLVDAKLNGANLTKACLIGADLHNADLLDAVITNADFTGAKGLSTIKSLDMAKGTETAKGLEGFLEISPGLEVEADVKAKETAWVRVAESVMEEKDVLAEVVRKARMEMAAAATEESEKAEKDPDKKTEDTSEVEVDDNSGGGDGKDDGENPPPEAPKLWLTAWSPTAHPDQHYIDLDPLEEIIWEVPKGALPGDHILFYITEGTGLLYICGLLDINEKRSKNAVNINYAKLRIKYRFEHSIKFSELEADERLKSWHLVKKNMRNAAASQKYDIKSQQEIWKALKELIIKLNPESSSLFLKIEEKKPVITLQESLLSDERATEDALGHGTIVTILARFLSSKDTGFPLSIAIDAPWGTGKSTFMYLLQNELQHRDKNLPDEFKELCKGKGDDKYVECLEDNNKNSKKTPIAWTWNKLLEVLDKKEEGTETGTKRKAPASEPEEGRSFETVYFNAWRHGSGDRLTASMVSHIINTIADRKGIVEKERFWLNLNMKRLDLTSLRWDIHRKILTGSIKIFASLGIFTVASLLIFILLLANDHSLGAVISFLLSGGSAVVWKYAWQAAKDKTVSYDFSPHFRAPDYEKIMGPQTMIEKDFLHVINSLADEGKSLAVFVDDLDRCSPNQVVDVVEAINVFFGQQCKDCVFIIGMHRELVATSLELAYKELVGKIEAAPHLSEELPYGQRFLEKIVQFVVRLPEPGADDIKKFLAKLLSPSRGVSMKTREEMPSLSAMKTDPDFLIKENIYKEKIAADYQSHGFDKDESIGMSEKDIEVERAVQIAETYDERSSEVAEIFMLVKVALRSNPRQYVRFFNALRFDYYLSPGKAKRPEKPGMDDFLIMAKWVVISLEWPVLANLILPERDEFNTILGKGSKAIVTRALIRTLVKKLIDVKTEKGKDFLKKMMEIISDERMTTLLEVKIPSK